VRCDANLDYVAEDGVRGGLGLSHEAVSGEVEVLIPRERVAFGMNGRNVD